MSKASSFQGNSVNVKKKVVSCNGFLGVDYSTQKFNINGNRAVDLLNYIYKQGVIQKRNGFEEIFNIQPTSYVKMNFDGSKANSVSTNNNNFNGIWQFIAEDNQNHIVAHIGKLFYEITNIDNNYIEVNPIKADSINSVINGVSYPVCYEFLNLRSDAFVGSNKLWILTGNKYMVLRFIQDQIIFQPVEQSEYASIPTTTISITYEHALANQRNSYDSVNLLQKFRTNKLISGVGKNELGIGLDEYYEYVLDAPLICENENVDMANFSMTIKERGKTG